jgi:plasmid stabilization system protein ParE
MKYSSILALETKQSIKNSILENLVSNPYVAPISDRMIDIGISDYRQFSIDKHNIVFYRIDESKKQVVLLVIMDSRQSIQKLLSEIILLF